VTSHIKNLSQPAVIGVPDTKRGKTNRLILAEKPKDKLHLMEIIDLIFIITVFSFDDADPIHKKRKFGRLCESTPT